MIRSNEIISLQSHYGAGRRGRLPLPPLRRFLARAREAVGLAGGVGVRLLDDAAIQRLNRQFRRADAPTDVLSFPGADGYGGDIAISLDTAARQARQRRHRLECEVRVLLLHGLLHLAGHDHDTDQGEMARRERHLRRRLGLPPGLIERRWRRKMEAGGH